MSFLGILKFLFFAASGGIAFRQFVESNHTTQVAKIAGVIVFLVSVIFVIPDVMAFFKDNEASETEQEYWHYCKESPSLTACNAYLEKYPDGEFTALVKDKLAKLQPSVLPSEPKPEPVATAPVEAPPIAEPVAVAPVEESKPVSEESWQTIDRYQVKDGLVKDTQTGLMWMRCSLGQNWNGSTCAGDVAKYKWEEAMKTPNDFSYAGYSDWRVPTIKELNTLVYCSNGKTIHYKEDGYNSDGNCGDNYERPTIKSEVFLNTPSDWFWSSSPGASSSGYAWVVGFDGGNGYYGNKNGYYAVRLVRVGQ